MVGIVSYGAYIPIYRLTREEIGRVWGTGGGRGEKAVANCDEDSLTMGVEAAVDCLQEIDRKSVDGLYFASTTPPYKEKQSASIIRAALDLNPDITTADFTDSLRAGTSALRAAIDAVKAGSAEKVLVVSADCRLPAPNSEFENLFGDGAAAFLIGSSEVALNVEGSYTTSSEFIDVWRGQNDPYPRTWEDRFVSTYGYLEVMQKAILTAMKKYNLSPKDFVRAVFPGPDVRSHSTMARKLGFDYQNQVQDTMLSKMGNTGAAFGLMMLVAAIEETKPGGKILFSNYGDGCDCYIFEVTDYVRKLMGRRGIQKNLSSKMYLSHYGKYLRFRNLMEWEPDRRPSEYSSLTTLWRDRKQVLALIGHKCKNCGKVQIDFPIQRVCAWCQSKDQFDEVRLSDKKGILFSFSMDERTRDLDLPCVTAVVDIGEGARFLTVMTDRDPQTLKVGMPAEFTFRKIHDGQGICNYFWKCRPVRS
jgi:hydroxymethylglutaryl-CoA synthase